MQENFSGARVVKAYVQEDNEARAFERRRWQFERRNIVGAALDGLWPMLTVLIGLST